MLFGIIFESKCVGTNQNVLLHVFTDTGKIDVNMDAEALYDTRERICGSFMVPAERMTSFQACATYARQGSEPHRNSIPVAVNLSPEARRSAAKRTLVTVAVST